MATLIPNYSSCASRMTAGERRLAQRLEAKLDEDYVLWYDVPVGPKRLHPDFVLLHPAHGVLVLEVKDWKLETIQSVAHNGFNIVVPPHGALKSVKNPLQQARDYVLAIASLLQQDEALVQTSGRHKGKLLFPYAYGVVLTNISRSKFNAQPALAQVLDEHLVICKDEMLERTEARDLQERLRAMSPYSFG